MMAEGRSLARTAAGRRGSGSVPSRPGPGIPPLRSGSTATCWSVSGRVPSLRGSGRERRGGSFGGGDVATGGPRWERSRGCVIRVRLLSGGTRQRGVAAAGTAEERSPRRRWGARGSGVDGPCSYSIEAGRRLAGLRGKYFLGLISLPNRLVRDISSDPSGSGDDG